MELIHMHLVAAVTYNQLLNAKRLRQTVLLRDHLETIHIGHILQITERDWIHQSARPHIHVAQQNTVVTGRQQVHAKIQSRVSATKRRQDAHLVDGRRLVCHKHELLPLSLLLRETLVLAEWSKLVTKIGKRAQSYTHGFILSFSVNATPTRL